LKKIIILLLTPIIILFANTFKNYIYNVSGKVETFLLVDKTKQKLFVIDEDSTGNTSIIDTFRVTTGRSPGDKEKEGDLKTPEGIYTIIRKISDNKLPEKYGPLAFILDYPNFVDRINKKNGSNIWIHGRNEEIMDFQTEGCVSLENGHILDLAKYVTLQRTKLVIVDSLEASGTNWEEYHRELRDFIENWKTNWSDGNLEKYFDCYSDNFKENGHSFETFKKRKTRIEKNYSWKKIEIDSLRFLISKREVVASFHQTYVSPNFTSIGEKQLLLIADSNGFNIVKEDFRRIGNRIPVNEEISKFIALWEESWESIDVEKFLSLYSEKFVIDGKDVTWFADDKKMKFSKIIKIDLKVSNINSHSSKIDQWVVTFKQQYQADNYKDVGFKTMIVEKQENGEFKILNEVWRRSK